MKHSLKQQMCFLVYIFLNQCALAQNQGNSTAVHWQIKQKTSGFSYNTSTKTMSVKNIEKQGLISVARRGDFLLQNFWQEGAYRSTMSFNSQIIIDGYDINDVSRINSFRFDKQGNYIFIRTAKGPKSKTELILNGETIYSWPRLTNIKILTFAENKITIALYMEKQLTTQFYRYDLNEMRSFILEDSFLGRIDGCTVLSSKVLKAGLLLETYCQANYGSDVLFLNYKSKKIMTISASTGDEFIGYALLDRKQKKSIKGYPILTLEGSTSARQLYHAISGVFLKFLGEPMSRSSDEAGKQSWSQSYRTLTLSELYSKTKHPSFAILSTQAMEATLRQQNTYSDISEQHNPPCAWASRIYSQDSITPISFLINQAMIANSLIHSCNKVGSFCSSELKRKIDDNAICLVNEYKYLFDEGQGLYRIPYASNFRYDGLYSPWNWHLSWAAVMKYVARITKNKQLKERADNIIAKFIASWEFTAEQHPKVLWKYWTPHFYKGWQVKDKVSLYRPKQKPAVLAKLRYEDLNHAGISLLGLSFSKHSLSNNQQIAITNTINNLLSFGSMLPRDMNGKGPRNPRWSLGAGWHKYASNSLKELYAHKLPNNVSNNKHYAYALLSDSNAPFFLQLSLSTCELNEYSTLEINRVSCDKLKTWSWHKISDFINDNPLFSLKELLFSNSTFQ